MMELFLGIILAGIGSLFAGLFFFQEKMIFFPTSLPADYRFRFTSHFEEHFVLVNGEKTHALYFKKASAKGTILFFHGNAGALDSWGEVGENLSVRSGWNVWIVDFPGYGKSEGKIRSEKQLLELGRAHLMALRKEAPSQKVVLLGRSIGSGIAVYLASENAVNGLVLETPYLSLEKLVAKVAPWAPSFILKYKMRSEEWIRSVKVPILVIHGQEDEVIPFAQAEDLAKISPQARLVAIPGAHHNDLLNFPEYWTALDRFLESVGKY